MKKFVAICFFCVAACLSLPAQTVVKNTRGVKVQTQGMNVEVTFYSPSIVRVFKTPVERPYTVNSLIVVKEPQQVDVKMSMVSGGNTVMLQSSAVQVEMDCTTGAISFRDASGKLLVKDKEYGTSFGVNEMVEDRPLYQVRSSFLLEKDEPIYGVGQVMDGKMNRRGGMYHLQNENMFTYSPYFMSPTKGYAVYWDNYSISDFMDSPQELAFTGLGYCSDYYFMYGGTPDGVIACVRDLTGKAPMLPLWAYGFFQSKERYKTQEENLSVLQRYRQLQIPIDCMIQDWRYWAEYNKTDSAWNSQSFDPERFPDPKKWVDEIHALNAKLMIVTWPGFGPKTAQRQELDSKGMILGFNTWPPRSGAKPYDVFNPEALDIYWKYLNKGIFSYIGNDGWWLDSTEPDHINPRDSDFNLPTYLGPYKTVKNAYSVMHNKGIATHQKETTKDKRVVLLTRSGFIGQQRYGSITWSGDVQSTWDMLEKQIPAALNFTLMGIPNWNSDIGGFFANRWNKGGGARNPEYQELYVRWMQFGTFCPMMRSHGTEVPREIWNFGDPGDWCFDAQARAIALRYSMLPYNYSTAWDVSAHDGTFMRALVMDFADDPNTYNLGGEYLFGRSLLVAPVTKPGMTSWPVYLPKGADWWNFWTNEKAAGGQTVTCAAPKDIVPLYVKAGSILPFGPKVQYSGEKNWDNLEVRVYPGADGTFTFYEDQKDNYNYEQGAYATIEFRWNDATRELTIGTREGSFPGMLAKRKFNVVIVNKESGVGDAPMKGKAVTYNGKEKVVTF